MSESPLCLKSGIVIQHLFSYMIVGYIGIKLTPCAFFLFGNFCFRTYSKVQIFPGPGLNVVIGANGTGKSTIVCGICLGLGGKPSILGRATSVTEYIKHGETTAVIEIEL